MKQVCLALVLIIGCLSSRAMFGEQTPDDHAGHGHVSQPLSYLREDPWAIYRVPVEDSPTKGPVDALVTIVESLDFECPYSKEVGSTLKKLEQAYPGKLRFVFKHNPLDTHEHALSCALAAEEARVQKGEAGFWTMRDQLFDAAPALDTESVEKAAVKVGLNLAKFRTALAGKAGEARIRRDQRLVASLGATGTPVFFVNGRKLSGAHSFESFKGVVDEELKKAQAKVASGIPAAKIYAARMKTAATAPVMVSGPLSRPLVPVASIYRKVALRADETARGPVHAKLTLVLFSDFECPYCSRIGPLVDQLEMAYPDQLRIVWRHFPLSMHSNARPAALAVEAAREQGKFWQMNDRIFGVQNSLSANVYERIARELGLDMAKFMVAVASPKGEARIAEDLALGGEAGVKGTPTLFLNGRKISSVDSFEMLKGIAEEELKKADELLAKGVKLDGEFHARICDANVAAALAPIGIEVRPDDPVKGSKEAPVTLVIFSEFQCPFTAKLEVVLKELEKSYGDKVRIAWKHKLLANHLESLSAAEAAEAAREQGKFWPMQEKLFAGQKELSSAAYERWAGELGLDLAKFKAAIATGKFRGRIQQDDELANRFGISKTPTLVVGSEVFNGVPPIEILRGMIDRNLNIR